MGPGASAQYANDSSSTSFEAASLSSCLFCESSSTTCSATCFSAFSASSCP
eukprot:CAMPEP_0115149376 /NCGR_PEP_ID=MMETSP0227-20121206/64405_1 /TAXON_ID=89957 /ORGANISM="Polarella glacialis, Strain CCMP 1383" /LENGTH=50 /DNA_ID=CAMNT_0002559535 /DNA_START=97 /DNA_END=245 /DNA_ORIENTATION=+